jgi:hypothetical protein
LTASFANRGEGNPYVDGADYLAPVPSIPARRPAPSNHGASTSVPLADYLVPSLSSNVHDNDYLAPRVSSLAESEYAVPLDNDYLAPRVVSLPNPEYSGGPYQVPSNDDYGAATANGEQNYAMPSNQDDPSGPLYAAAGFEDDLNINGSDWGGSGQQQEATYETQQARQADYAEGGVPQYVGAEPDYGTADFTYATAQQGVSSPTYATFEETTAAKLGTGVSLTPTSPYDMGEEVGFGIGFQGETDYAVAGTGGGANVYAATAGVVSVRTGAVQSAHIAVVEGSAANKAAAEASNDDEFGFA